MENIEWGKLGFNYYKTAYNVRFHYADGKWGAMEATDDEYMRMHISAACLHYGLEIFEGLKAFRGVDGKVRLFRPEENAKRMISSAERLCLPMPSVEMFVEACKELVKLNADYIPPYGTGASLYLRPMLIGSKACLGVKAVDEADFIVFCSPVGPYFKEGMKPIKAVIDREQDRAAPRGTGDVKVGGNYASSIFSGVRRCQLLRHPPGLLYHTQEYIYPALYYQQEPSSDRSRSRIGGTGAPRSTRRALDIRGVRCLRYGCRNFARRFDL